MPTPKTLLLGLMSLGLLAEPVAAAMYKCTDAQGTVSYQQLPCPGRPADEGVLEVKEQPKLGTGTPEDSIPKPKPSAPQATPGLAETAEPPPQSPASNVDMVECQTPNGQTIRVPAEIGCLPERHFSGPGGPAADRPGNGPGPNGPLRRGRVMSGQRGPAVAESNTSESPSVYQPQPSDPEAACEAARAEGERRRRENMSLSFDERSKLDARVREACGQ